MRCQKEIAAQICEQQGDYLMALRDNYPLLHKEAEQEMVLDLRRETTQTVGVKAKRLRADWNEHYLKTVLAAHETFMRLLCSSGAFD